MSGKTHPLPTHVPEWLGGGVPTMDATPGKNINRPVFVDPSGRRVVAARLSAAALTLAGAAFIAGAGVLLANQPTPTALADILSPGALARAVGTDPIADVLTNALTGEVAPASGQSPAVSGQGFPRVEGVDVDPATQLPVGAAPGGAPAGVNPYTGQGELAPSAPIPGSPPVTDSPVPAPPVAAPPVAAPPVDVPPVVVPPAEAPPVVVPPVDVPPVVIGETPAEPPAGPLAPVVDPVVETVETLLGAVL